MSERIYTGHLDRIILYRADTGALLDLGADDLAMTEPPSHTPSYSPTGLGRLRLVAESWAWRLHVVDAAKAAALRAMRGDGDAPTVRVVGLGDESIIWDEDASLVLEDPSAGLGQLAGRVVNLSTSRYGAEVERSPNLTQIHPLAAYSAYESGGSPEAANAAAGTITVTDDGEVAALFARRALPASGLRLYCALDLATLPATATVRLRAQPYTWDEREATYDASYSLAASETTATRSGRARVVLDLPDGAHGVIVAVEVEGNDLSTETLTLTAAPVLLTRTPSGERLDSIVLPPAGFGWSPPFDIIKEGGGFRVASDFDLRAYAGVDVQAEYFVGPGGSDANSGLLRSDAFATLKAALLAISGTPGRITLLDGTKLDFSQLGSDPTADLEIIGEGSALLTARLNEYVGSFAPHASLAGVYEASVGGGQTVARVYDNDTADAQGDATRYLAAASVAAVGSTPGSWYQDAPGGTLYVHRPSGATPGGADIDYLNNNAWYYNNPNIRVYAKNVEFRGGVQFIRSGSGGALTGFYLDGCTNHFLTIQGVECIIKGGLVRNSETDGINVDPSSIDGTPAYIVTIDTLIRDVGEGGNGQAFTIHDEVYSVDVNPRALRTTGQGFGDAGDARRWVLGGTSDTSTVAEVSYYTEGSMWLDSCASANNATALQNSEGQGGTIRIRDFDAGGGSYDMHAPNPGDGVEEY